MLTRMLLALHLLSATLLSSGVLRQLMALSLLVTGSHSSLHLLC